MKGMGRIYRVLILIYCVCIAVGFTGCFGPTGSIGGSGSMADLLWVVPIRTVYELNNLFLRNSDLQVFGSYRGAVEPVPVEDVKIGIAEDPDLPDKLNYIPKNENYAWQTKGRKTVVVEYSNMSAHYYIEVWDSLGLGEGNGNRQGGSIEVEWGTP